MVELLLSGDTNTNNQSGQCDIFMEDIISAFTIAFYEGHSSVMIILSNKLTTLSSDERELLVAAAEGDIGALVSMLFEVGMSPDTSLVGGITPLMIAASCGHIGIVDTLIQAGADVNETSNAGCTGLEIAEGINHRDDIIKLLISKTPTHKSDPVRKKQKGRKSIIGYFLLLFKKAFNPAQMKHNASFENNSTSIKIMS